MGIAGLRKKYGVGFVQEIFAYAIIDLCENMNVGNSMNEAQIINAADLLQREYWMLKPEDIRVCFDMVKLGKLGKTYGRIDVQALSEYMSLYMKYRFDQAEALTLQENSKFKRLENGITDVPILDKVKWYQEGLKRQEIENKAEKERKEMEREQNRNNHSIALENFKKEMEQHKTGRKGK